jgi:hypothetical protein
MCRTASGRRRRIALRYPEAEHAFSNVGSAADFGLFEQ